uniref:Uncharacterized protein n=1 Tax=Wuchereria bancrofti TaxID=6293 RepID=A0AAF5Q3S2_WUCBA
MNAGYFTPHKTCDENQEIDEYNDHSCDKDPRMDTSHMPKFRGELQLMSRKKFHLDVPVALVHVQVRYIANQQFAHYLFIVSHSTTTKNTFVVAHAVRVHISIVLEIKFVKELDAVRFRFFHRINGQLKGKIKQIPYGKDYVSDSKNLNIVIVNPKIGIQRYVMTKFLNASFLRRQDLQVAQFERRDFRALLRAVL